MHNSHLFLKNISKIEGHAHLSLDVKKGEVKNVEFKVSENKRFFEKIILGRRAEEIPLLVSRICGFCSSSHCTTAIEAVEKAFEVEVSEQTDMLRDLLLNGEFLKSHSLHLFFLALPDYLGKESVLEFDKKQHKLIHLGLDLKKLGTEILQMVGGRAYHTTNELVGGFKKIPEKKELESLLPSLEQGRSKAEKAIRLFVKFKPQFERETDYVGLVNKDYSFLAGDIISSAGVCIPEELYSMYLEEIVVPYSLAKEAKFAGKEFMVGALARINLNRQNLGRKTKKIIRKLKLPFPSHSPFLNNLAQAVELYQCIDSSIYLINEIKCRRENLKKIKPREAIGIGITEAPRGVLYHEYEFNKSGKIKNSNIIVPTQQNTRNIEEDIKEFLPPLLDLPKPRIELELEKLIRAYDPCISCATHFLEVDWKQH